MKGFINEEQKQQIMNAADLRHTIEHYVPLEERGREITGQCPMCHHDGGLHYVKSKGMYKCFHCDFGGNSPVKYVMESQGLNYNEALHELADIFHIVIDHKPKVEKIKAVPLSFKNRQLAESGLTKQEVRAKESSEECGVQTTTDAEVFVAGTLDNFDNIVAGDDMVIRYLDLEGQQLQFYREGDRKAHNYYRVRWQFPESHALKDGTICKYKTPYGAGLHLYIPEKLRDIYRRAEQIESLYFTEGEKKAEKASKHGMPAFGMAGINCLVGKERQFPESVVKVIERCGVQRVYFLLDSDWDDLSRDLRPDKDVAQRGRNFFYAVRRFRDWFKTLANRHIYVEVYIVLQRGEAKGIDDLLTTTLSGHEESFVADLQHATNEVAATNNFPLFDLYKITSVSDGQLSDIWHLNSIDNFVAYHRERLCEMPEFLYNKNLWRIDEEGQLVLAQPLRDDEIFWKGQEYQTKGGTVTKYTFAYNNACHFFNNRGFYRYRQPNNTYKFIRVEQNRVSEIHPHQARDYAIDLVRNICAKNDDIIDMILRGSKMYFGADALGHIDYYEPQFISPSKESEILLFRDNFVRVSADGIEANPLHSLANNYWQEQVKDFDFLRVIEPLITVDKIGGDYFVKASTECEKCEFANFLFRTGMFDWDKYCNEEREQYKEFDDDIIQMWNLHFLSKMTAIGYLLHRFREKSTAKAVIGMDGIITEVGSSNGRSGKSLLGLALEQMLNQVTINGKNCDPVGDKFLFEEVNERTQNIFIDDVCVNFNFEEFFPIITGKLSVNAKGVGRFTLSDHQVPKLYITTNHAINGDSGSFEARQFKLAFSDYYDKDFQPRQQFGHDFFDDWDSYQWNLFYNFMAECLQLYFYARQKGWGDNGSGLISAPCENLERRQLRQEMGEVFLNWMNDYLNVDDDSVNTPQCGRVNNRLVRSQMSEDFLTKCPTQRRYYTPQRFWKQICLYCRYYGLRLNPVESKNSPRPLHCKIHGVEYITIANSYFESSVVKNEIPY